MKNIKSNKSQGGFIGNLLSWVVGLAIIYFVVVFGITGGLLAVKATNGGTGTNAEVAERQSQARAYAMQQHEKYSGIETPAEHAIRIEKAMDECRMTWDGCPKDGYGRYQDNPDYGVY